MYFQFIFLKVGFTDKAAKEPIDIPWFPYIGGFWVERAACFNRKHVARLAHGSTVYLHVGWTLKK
jgi:hypothetical protein